MKIEDIEKSLKELESEIGYCHENCYHYDTDGEQGEIICCNNYDMGGIPDKLIEKIHNLEIKCPFWTGNYSYCKNHRMVYPSRLSCRCCVEEVIKEMRDKVTRFRKQ